MSEIPIAFSLRIRHYLLGLIREAHGEARQIPTERDLASRFRVSRGTARKAILHLVKDGYLVSRHGMGTYINPDSLYSLTNVANERLKVGLIFGDGRLAYYGPSHGAALSEFASEFSHSEIDFTIISLNSGGGYTFDYLNINSPDGVVWYRPSLVAKELLQELASRGFPTVLVDCPFEVDGLVSITTDFSSVGRMAAERLIHLGHTRILFAGLCRRNHLIEFQCRKSFFEKLEQAGLPFGGDLECNNPEAEIKGEFTAAFLAHHFFVNSLSKSLKASQAKNDDMDVVLLSNFPDEAPGMRLEHIVCPFKKLARKSLNYLKRQVMEEPILGGQACVKPKFRKRK